MIVPFDRQGPAGTLKQHCPRMTGRRCRSVDILLTFCENMLLFFTGLRFFPFEARTPSLIGVP